MAAAHLVDRWQAHELWEERRERYGERVPPGGSQRCVEQLARLFVQRHAALNAHRLARIEPPVDGQSYSETDVGRQRQRRHGLGVHTEVGGRMRFEL
jgi:hypothetical protein